MNKFGLIREDADSNYRLYINGRIVKEFRTMTEMYNYMTDVVESSNIKWKQFRVVELYRKWFFFRFERDMGMNLLCQYLDDEEF